MMAEVGAAGRAWTSRSTLVAVCSLDAELVAGGSSMAGACGTTVFGDRLG